MNKIIHVYSPTKGHFDIQYNNNVTEGCDKIIEHRPSGEGDKWHYDVVKNNRIIRLFDVTCATLEK